jgi:hypothetical protein
MNNADRFKTGQPFYALVTQVSALLALTSSNNIQNYIIVGLSFILFFFGRNSWLK